MPRAILYLNSTPASHCLRVWSGARGPNSATFVGLACWQWISLRAILPQEAWQWFFLKFPKYLKNTSQAIDISNQYPPQDPQDGILDSRAMHHMQGPLCATQWQKKSGCHEAEFKERLQKECAWHCMLATWREFGVFYFCCQSCFIGPIDSDNAHHTHPTLTRSRTHSWSLLA